MSYYRQRSVRRAASCTSEESLSPTSSPLVLPETEAESGISEGKSPCPTPSASDGDSGVGSSCSTTSEEASLWDPQEAGKKSLEKGQGNAYPFSLVPLERLAEPWDIYPRCDEIIKSAGARGTGQNYLNKCLALPKSLRTSSNFCIRKDHFVRITLEIHLEKVSRTHLFLAVFVISGSF